MILEEQLKLIIDEQKEIENKKAKIVRNTFLPETSDRIVVISGVRRCGKSTLLRETLGKKEESISINFEDPRLDAFELNDFYKLEKIAKESDKNFFIFDEIQNVPGWEKYARSAYDTGKKIYITGSNASMLSKELGTKLTGRYMQIELFPFDFSEYLLFHEKTANANSFKEFLHDGGFPEYLKEQNPEYLHTLLKDIISRDIVVRRGIKNEHFLIRLAVYLLSNISKEFSYNNITQILSIKSVRSTIDYCDFLEESYLVEFITRFSYSIKQQQNNPKKAYCIDTGMAKMNSLSFSDDYGRLLENAVYLQLRKHSREISYFKDEKSECDFVLKSGREVSFAIQVCWQLTPDNMEREISGLKRAMEATRAQKGIIITFDQSDNLDGFDVIPAWKWQL
jgi:predicted AAA+ superfamily ATPase